MEGAMRDLEEFWGRLWFHILNVLGVIVLLAGVALAGVAILAPSHAPSWVLSMLQSTSPPELNQNPELNQKPELNRAAVSATRLIFQKQLLRAEKQCARRDEKGRTDLSRCTIFEMRPGKTGSVGAIEIIDASGFFSSKAILVEASKTDTGKLNRRIYMSEKGVLLLIEFTNEDYIVAGITMTIDADVHPYFDAKALHSTILELVGAPDSNDDFRVGASWGSDKEPYDLSLRAYEDDNRYWLVFKQKQPDRKKQSKE
jgi:hypothetical protein